MASGGRDFSSSWSSLQRILLRKFDRVETHCGGIPSVAAGRAIVPRWHRWYRARDDRIATRRRCCRRADTSQTDHLRECRTSHLQCSATRTSKGWHSTRSSFSLGSRGSPVEPRAGTWIRRSTGGKRRRSYRICGVALLRDGRLSGWCRAGGGEDGLALEFRGGASRAARLTHRPLARFPSETRNAVRQR